MTTNDVPVFGITDYCLFAAMLAVSTGIGVVFSCKVNKSKDDYLLGSRSFKPIPIAMSLLTTLTSAINLLGFTGEVYAHGLQFSVYVAGMVPAVIFSNFFILPVIFPLKLTSINEYIEMRFKSKLLRSFVLLLSTVNGFMYAGIYLYAPTIALASVTPFSVTTYVYLLGIVCTIYSTIGGFKAVVWTGVFQMSVGIVGITLIMILGCINLGGLVNVWTITKDGGRFDMLRMDFGFYGRYTLPNMFLYGFFIWLAVYGTSQINAQRMNCVKTIKEARLVLFSNTVGYVIVCFLIFTSGTMCYAAYAGCDPLKSNKITKIDQILTFFVIDKFSYLTGLPGLFVATIVGGALSSISSVISSQVSIMWKDGLSHLHIMEKITPQVDAIIKKVMSLLVGSVVIGMALWSSQSDGMAEFGMVILSGISGSILGIFLLAFFFPTCNTKGALCGLTISVVLVGWITIGGLLYRPKPILLPLSIENCTDITNSTSEEFSQLHYEISESTITNGNSLNQTSNQEFEFPLMWIYGISPTLYPGIATIVCVVIGLTVSFATGSQNLSEVSPKLITPLVRKIYWTKEELIRLEKELKIELYSYSKGDIDEYGNNVITREGDLSFFKKPAVFSKE